MNKIYYISYIQATFTLYLITTAESYEINNLEYVTRICGIFEIPIEFRFSKTIINYEF